MTPATDAEHDGAALFFAQELVFLNLPSYRIGGHKPTDRSFIFERLAQTLSCKLASMGYCARLTHTGR